MGSNRWSIVTTAAFRTCTVSKMQAVESHVTLIWPVKSNITNNMPSYHFLYMINSNPMPSMHRFQDTGCWKSCDLDLTFQGHHRSNLISPVTCPCITSYTLLIVTICLTCTVSKMQAVESHDCYLDITFQGLCTVATCSSTKQIKRNRNRSRTEGVFPELWTADGRLATA